MKQILILSMILISISCSNNEVISINHSQHPPLISFNTLRNKATTRHANDNRSTYKVYSVIDNTDAWYFNTVVIPTSSNAEGAIDTCANTYYWPGTNEVTFYAFAPSEIADSTGIVSISDTYPDITITYTVPQDALIDFTIAAPITQAASADGSNKAVPLSFSHMLCRIVFNAVLSEELINAGYTLNNPYPLGDLGHSFTIILPYDSGRISVTDDSPSWTYNDVSNTTYSGNIGYMILPQTYSDDNPCKIQLNDVVIKYGDTTFFSGSLETYTLTSTDLTNATFEMGKQYNITITITNIADDDDGKPIFNGKIEFSSAIVNWNDEIINSITQP